MKKIIFTLLGLLMITSTSAQESGFIPVLSEGKSWEVARLSNHPLDYPEKMDTINIYAITVSGDTIVNNFTCKKIEIVSQNNKNQSKTAVAYEENGKVWNIREDGEMELLFDIGLHLYDEINTGYVIEEDYISVNGVNRKRLYIDTGIDSDFNYEYLYYYIVEGIGANNNIWIGSLIDDIGPCVMLSCSENGETIFTYNDFNGSSIGDEYVPLVREGVVWEYVEYNSEFGIHPDVASIYTLEFNGVCDEGHKLYRTDYNANGTTNEPCLVAYVNEENKVMAINIDDNLPYYLNIYTSQFDKIYDFNNGELYFLPNEAIYFSYQLADDVISSEAFTIEVGNTTRNGYHVNYDAEHDIDLKEFKIIEGIGVDCMYGDLLEPFCNFPTGPTYDDAMGWRMAGLSAVYENGELVYQGCLYNDAQRLKTSVGINTIDENKQVAGVRYYNIAGIESSEPWQGMNIRVTTYTDGSRHTDKIIR